MRIAIFILSNILLIAAIVMVIKHKGSRFIGLDLTKKWAVALAACELLIAILCYVSYTAVADATVANDMLWNSLIANYRGVLPIAGLMQIVDFKISGSASMQVILMLFGALIFDYVILKVVTLFKGKKQS